MTKKDFKLGTKVKRTDSKRIGEVVADSFDLCDDKSVMVEFDGVFCVASVNCGDLVILGVVEPEIDSEKCRGCIFFNGARCLRYSAGRLGMILSGKNNKRLPNRIYPFCQNS